MAKDTYYNILGIVPDVSPLTISAVIQARLQTARGDEREQLLLARDTLLDPDSRESYDRLNGITPTRTHSEVKQENRAALEAYNDEELARREESAYALWAWVVNLVTLGLSIGLWMIVMLHIVPPIAEKIAPLLVAFQLSDHAALVVGLFFTVLFLVVGWLVANIYTQAMSVTLRFMAVCGLLAALLFAANSAILSSNMAWGIRAIASAAVMLCAFQFVRYLGVRQLRTLGQPPIPPQRKR